MSRNDALPSLCVECVLEVAAQLVAPLLIESRELFEGQGVARKPRAGAQVAARPRLPGPRAIPRYVGRDSAHSAKRRLRATRSERRRRPLTRTTSRAGSGGAAVGSPAVALGLVGRRQPKSSAMWRLVTLTSRAVRVTCAPARTEDVGEVELNRLFELLVGARLRLPVGTPAHELGGVTEANPLHVVVADLHHPLRAQRGERGVAVGQPSGCPPPCEGCGGPPPARPTPTGALRRSSPAAAAHSSNSSLRRGHREGANSCSQARPRRCRDPAAATRSALRPCAPGSRPPRSRRYVRA